MQANEKYGQLASVDSVKKTMESLAKNWIHSFLVDNRKEAKEKILEFIPKFSEIMTMTSTTLMEAEIDETLNESYEYISVRKKMVDQNISSIEKQRLWAAPEWAIWSIHAVTEDGNIMIASATWSQLSAYAYWALNVIWVVWTQKIVSDIAEAEKRIHEYSFPLENERALKTYWTWSWINKVLVINKEVIPWRIHIIFVKEKLGF